MCDQLPTEKKHDMLDKLQKLFWKVHNKVTWKPGTVLRLITCSPWLAFQLFCEAKKDHLMENTFPMQYSLISSTVPGDLDCKQDFNKGRELWP